MECMKIQDEVTNFLYLYPAGKGEVRLGEAHLTA